MKKTIERFINHTLNDNNHRFKSWEHCYFAFGNKNESTDILALHLGFYLASWGMYRGSSGLLWKDYKVHIAAVEILKNNFHLRHDSVFNILLKKNVLSLFNELSENYSKLQYFKKDEPRAIAATDTLISKILLGSLGCLPAFDRYFNKGLFDNENSVINMKSLDLIWLILEERKPQIETAQEWIIQQTGVVYPPMKILDMYFWQKGMENLESLKK